MKYTTTMSVEDVMNSVTFVTKYEAVTSEEPYLTSLLAQLAQHRSFKVGCKAMQTAAEKILRKLPSKPHYSEDEMADLLRGRIVANDAKDAQMLLSQLQEKVEIIALDNYSINPNVWGYNGINLNILTPNGHKVEVQIHTPETRAVQKALHGLYEEWRNELEIPLEVFEKAKRMAKEAIEALSK